MLLHSAAVTEVSGLEPQNAAIYDVPQIAAAADQSVHLNDGPSSPVNTARSHVSTAQSVEAEEASTKPQTSVARRTQSIEGDSAASVAADDVHSSLGPSQLATAQDRAVTSHRQSASPSPSANGMPQQQRSVLSSAQFAAQGLHRRQTQLRDGDHAKSRMAHSTASREHSGPVGQANHTPASVYAQDGLPPLMAGFHMQAAAALLDPLQGGARRVSEVTQPMQLRALSDATLQFPRRPGAVQRPAQSSQAEAQIASFAQALAAQGRSPASLAGGPGTPSGVPAPSTFPVPPQALSLLGSLAQASASLAGAVSGDLLTPLPVGPPALAGPSLAQLMPNSTATALVAALDALADGSTSMPAVAHVSRSLTGQVDDLITPGPQGAAAEELPNGFADGHGAAVNGVHSVELHAMLPSSPQQSVMERHHTVGSAPMPLAPHSLADEWRGPAMQISIARSALGVIEQAMTEVRGDYTQAASGGQHTADAASQGVHGQANEEPVRSAGARSPNPAAPGAALTPNPAHLDTVTNHLQRTMSVKATHHPALSGPGPAANNRSSALRSMDVDANRGASPSYQAAAGPVGGSQGPTGAHAEGSQGAAMKLQQLSSLGVTAAIARGQHSSLQGRTDSAGVAGLHSALLHQETSHVDGVVVPPEQFPRQPQPPGSPSARAASVEAVLVTLNADRETVDNQSLSMQRGEPEGADQQEGGGASTAAGVLSAALDGAHAAEAAEGAASMSASEPPAVQENGAAALAVEAEADVISVGNAPQVSAMGSMWGATGAPATGPHTLHGRLDARTGSTRRGHEPRAQASGNAVASVSAGDMARGTAKGARSVAGATSRMRYQRGGGADSCDDDEAASERVTDRQRDVQGNAAQAVAGASNSNGEALGVIQGGGLGPQSLVEGDLFSDGRPPSPALSHRRPCASHVTGHVVPPDPPRHHEQQQVQPLSLLRVWEGTGGPTVSTEAVVEDAAEGAAYTMEAVSTRAPYGAAQSFTAGTRGAAQLPPGPPPNLVASPQDPSARWHGNDASFCAVDPFAVVPPGAFPLLQVPGGSSGGPAGPSPGLPENRGGTRTLSFAMDGRAQSLGKPPSGRPTGARSGTGGPAEEAATPSYAGRGVPAGHSEILPPLLRNAEQAAAATGAGGREQGGATSPLMTAHVATLLPQTGSVDLDEQQLAKRQKTGEATLADVAQQEQDAQPGCADANPTMSTSSNVSKRKRNQSPPV